MQGGGGVPAGNTGGAITISRNTIQSLLDENQQLILAILENQNLGRVHECAMYQQRLQSNLVFLASLADAHTTPTTPPPTYASPLLRTTTAIQPQPGENGSMPPPSQTQAQPQHTPFAPVTLPMQPTPNAQQPLQHIPQPLQSTPPVQQFQPQQQQHPAQVTVNPSTASLSSSQPTFPALYTNGVTPNVQQPQNVAYNNTYTNQDTGSINHSTGNGQTSLTGDLHDSHTQSGTTEETLQWLNASTFYDRNGLSL